MNFLSTQNVNARNVVYDFQDDFQTQCLEFMKISIIKESQKWNSLQNEVIFWGQNQTILRLTFDFWLINFINKLPFINAC